MLRHYFKTAFRSLWNSKLTTLINIIGLSVGMTAVVLIMIWVQTEKSFDDFGGNDTIYRLSSHVPDHDQVWETTPLLLADAIRQNIPEIERTARLYPNSQPVFKSKNKIFYEKSCAYVDSSWFSIFPYHFLQGSAAAFAQHSFTVILIASEAKKYFGTTSAVGQVMHIDSVDYQVTGVVSDPPFRSSFQYKAFIPVDALLSNRQIRDNEEQWNNANFITFIQVRPGSDPEVAANKITALLKKNAKEDAMPVSLVPLLEMHYESDVQNSAFVHGNRNTVRIFSILGFVLLLMACINYVNLTTAKSSLRAKDVSIRKIAGASLADLFWQFTMESVLVSVASLMTTLLFIQLSLPVFNQLTGNLFTLPIASIILWRTLALILLTAATLNSVYPALLLSSFKPLNVFRGDTLLNIKDTLLRKGLVVLQLTVSVILIGTTATLYCQLRFIQNSDSGYNRSQVLSFAMPPSMDVSRRASVMRSMKQDLQSQAGIESVASVSQPVVNMGSYCTECVDWAGRPLDYRPRIAQLSTDEDFQQLMQLKLRDGRWFSGGTASEGHDFILNEAAVRDFGWQAPIVGRSLIFKGDTGQVIGVIKDFSFRSLHEKIGPMVLFDNPAWRNRIMVRIAPKGMQEKLKSIQNIWMRYVPESPFEYAFLQESFDGLYKDEQQSSALIGIFSIIAIMLSCMGLFSLTALELQQRRREVGIRKVLGASSARITKLLSKDFFSLVCLAIFIGSPIAWWAMDSWIQQFAYRIELSGWIFAGAGILVLTITLLTVGIQAVKTALTNPVAALRGE